MGSGILVGYLPYLFDLAGGVWEFTTGNYVTGSGSAVDAYVPTDIAAGFGQTNLENMFGVDAIEYAPYFDAYPNPPLTDNQYNILNGVYGLGSSTITDNSNWGIYASKLGLGQALFETAQWSGAYANSITSASPWFGRRGLSDPTTASGIESISILSGVSSAFLGFRPLVRVLC